MNFAIVCRTRFSKNNSGRLHLWKIWGVRKFLKFPQRLLREVNFHRDYVLKNVWQCFCSVYNIFDTLLLILGSKKIWLIAYIDVQNTSSDYTNAFSPKMIPAWQNVFQQWRWWLQLFTFSSRVFLLDKEMFNNAWVFCPGFVFRK